MNLPFYGGQRVILNPALSDINRGVKHGVTYTISECVSKINPANGLGPFIYVGIIERHNGASWLSPKLFVPLQELAISIMTFEQIQELKPLEYLINN